QHFLKSEVLRIDDIGHADASRQERNLATVSAVRTLAEKIIDLLAQLEDFQKRLWLKRKLVLQTFWCVRVGCLPEELYPEIAANEAQREEWIRLGVIGGCGDDASSAANGVRIDADFLRAHPTLMIDTRHFEGAFVDRVIEIVGEVAQVDGVLVHSENFQALRFLEERLR